MLRTVMHATRFLARRLSPTERCLSQARWEVSTGNWAAAAAAYGRAAAANPKRADILVQWGHAFKEAGLPDRAIAIYRSATSLAPADHDVRLHLAALLRRQTDDHDEVRRLYREVLQIDPGNEEALRMLVELGARFMVPPEALVGDFSQADDARSIAGNLPRSIHPVDEAHAAFPLALYDRFRALHPLGPPPSSSSAPPPVAVVLGTGASAAMVDVTLDSLRRQSLRPSRIMMVVEDNLKNHPVASLAYDGLDICYSAAEATVLACSSEKAVVIIPAGIVLEDHTVAWLSFARERTKLETIYGDHDDASHDAIHGRYRQAPILFGCHDPIMIAQASCPPVTVMTSGNALRQVNMRDLTGWGVVAAIVARARDAVHVPGILASRYTLPATVRNAPRGGCEDQETTLPDGWRSAYMPRPICRSSKIAVIIPTRDHSALLHQAVTSLKARATAPERVEFIIIDNRSSEPETVATLAALARAGAKVLSVDAPFNWSRVNNLGAAQTDADLLVFANNDVEAVSSGWDDVVEQSLAQPNAGVLGVRLLYPGGSYQHAGVVFGVGKGLSVHEGVGSTGTEAGPNGRWLAARRVSAVTGAFMACARSTLIAAGGFDEGLAIAYNDLDFCFRARALGKSVVYEPRLCLLHHESKTRGQNVTQDQLAWDERERITFVERWSAEARRRDPGYNPQWASDGHPFDGIREPSTEEIIAWIDVGASGPWRTR